MNSRRNMTGIYLIFSKREIQKKNIKICENKINFQALVKSEKLSEFLLQLILC